MPLFRFHRGGGLDESLATTKIVKDVHALVALIIENNTASLFPLLSTWGLKIEPYPEKDNCFDKRIGWYTHIVSADLYEKDVYHPIGFLSEPIDE